MKITFLAALGLLLIASGCMTQPKHTGTFSEPPTVQKKAPCQHPLCLDIKVRK